MPKKKTIIYSILIVLILIIIFNIQTTTFLFNFFSDQIELISKSQNISTIINQNKEDPLIKIKQQEIDLRAMDLQRKAEETKFRADQENMRAAQRLEYEYDKLAQQDEQSDERLEVAREKIQSK